MPMDPRIEQRLVERAKTDTDAFGELYEHYFPKIYAYVSYRIRSTEQAEDIVSLTFSKALEKIGSYSYRGFSFSAWLFRIAHNNIIDSYRRDLPGRVIDIEQAGELKVDKDGPEDIAEKNEAYDKLRECMSELPEEAQNILSMKFGAGLSNRDIAKATGMPEGTVGSKLFRSLRMLREMMSEEESWLRIRNTKNC